MIIPAQHIRSRCNGTHPDHPISKPLLAPFSERGQFEGMTYGLSPAGYDVRIAEDVQISPTTYRGSFRLASTIERFIMPNDLLAVVHDKSTWARKGLAVQNTVIEPGWCGYLTLELSNFGDEVLTIVRGTPIAQVIFHLLQEPTEQPYVGRYQDQQEGPQVARYIHPVVVTIPANAEIVETIADGMRHVDVTLGDKE